MIRKRSQDQKQRRHLTPPPKSQWYIANNAYFCSYSTELFWFVPPGRAFDTNPAMMASPRAAVPGFLSHPVSHPIR